jgi:hypothetical protein
MGAGQISGIIFIYVMDKLRSPGTGGMTSSLAVFLLMMAISAFLALKLKESPVILDAQ